MTDPGVTAAADAVVNAVGPCSSRKATAAAVGSSEYVREISTEGDAETPFLRTGTPGAVIDANYEQFYPKRTPGHIEEMRLISGLLLVVTAVRDRTASQVDCSDLSTSPWLGLALRLGSGSGKRSLQGLARLCSRQGDPKVFRTTTWSSKHAVLPQGRHLTSTCTSHAPILALG